MSLIKKLSAIICVLALLLSFTGCHKKNEIAVTIGDIEFTSAYYMCAFVTADMQAQQKVSENLTEEEQNSTDVDIYSKKIDGKKYATWVKNTAISELKKIAAYKTLCADNKIELNDEQKAEAEQMTSYYWSSYGYQSLLEPNGVSLNTYKNYIFDSYYSTVYFKHLYGEGGKKEISADDIKKSLEENFAIANVLEAAYTSSEGEALGDTEKSALKTQFQNYADELTKGTRTFEEIYKEYNKITDEETEDTNTTEEEPKPMDEYATILGNEDSGYSSKHYETAKAMAVNEVKVVELEDGTGIAVIVKKDILDDPYYLENLDLTVRHLIKGDEFDKDIEKFGKTLDLEENTYATKQFKVKKIVYPESSY